MTFHKYSAVCVSLGSVESLMLDLETTTGIVLEVP